MNDQVNPAVRLKAALLFTRRVYQLTVDALRPFRHHWTHTSDGFTVTLWVLRESGTPDPRAVQLVAIPCAFGGRRYLLRCPG